MHVEDSQAVSKDKGKAMVDEEVEDSPIRSRTSEENLLGVYVNTYNIKRIFEVKTVLTDLQQE